MKRTTMGEQEHRKRLPKVKVYTLAITLALTSSISLGTQNISAKEIQAANADIISTSNAQATTNYQNAAQKDTYSVRGVHNEGSVLSSSNANVYETEHFQFLWGNSGSSSKVTQAFLQGNAKILEDNWNVYMNNLKMTSPSHSVTDSTKNDKNYKVNVVILGTGLPLYEGGWAFAGLDSEGFPYLMCDPGAMDPDIKIGLAVPHEFGHVVSFAQGDNSWRGNDYLGPWYEAIGNWFREEYSTSDLYKKDSGTNGTTDFSALFLRSSTLTPANGRCYYEAWPFLMYLEENPDNLPGYGQGFVAKMLKSGNPQNTTESIYELIQRLNSSLTIQETIAHFASRMATLDFKNRSLYKNSLNDMLRYNYLYSQQFYTMLNKVSDSTYAIPSERAPQAFGYNVIPLKVNFPQNAASTTISVKLNNSTAAGQSSLTAYIIAMDANGKTRYSTSFGSGNTMQMNVSSTDKVYLSVAATPSIQTFSKTKIGIGSWQQKFSEKNIPFESKPQYPYQVTLGNAEPQNRQIDESTNVSGHTHANGGGFVANSARVDASVYVGKNAKVLGSAVITGNARIDGFAVVSGAATVSGSAVIADNAWVKGSSQVSGNARIDGYAIVDVLAKVKDYAHVGDKAIVADNAQVFENGKVLESAQLGGYYTVGGQAVVKGLSLCLGGANENSHGRATGTAVTYGDFFDDYGYTISGGAFSGYESLQASVTNFRDNYVVSDGKGGYISSKKLNDETTTNKDTNLAASATLSAIISTPEDLGGVAALNDGYVPSSSTDKTHGVWHNWHGDEAGQAWVEYDWDAPKTLTGMDAYYFTDGNFEPKTVSVQVKDSNGNWVPVTNASGLGTQLNKFNYTSFNPVSTKSIRMYMTPKTLGCGVIEWKVYGH